MPRQTQQVVWLLLAVLLSGCNDADGLRQTAAAEPATPSPTESQATAGVPEEFEAACGKPGSRVVTERLEVTIKHSDCDLTGVIIVNQGRGLTVPEPGFGSGASSGVTIEVDEDTRDVTFTAEAEVADY